MLVLHIHPLIRIQYIILIPQWSDKKFEDVKRRTFSSGWKSKGVQSSRKYSHKSQCKATDALNIENKKYIWSMKPGKKWDINGQTSGNSILLGQETNRAGIFQWRHIFGTLNYYFSWHSFYPWSRIMSKPLMNKLINIWF